MYKSKKYKRIVEIYGQIQEKMEEIRKRYPKDMNLDNFEPSLSENIAELIYEREEKLINTITNFATIEIKNGKEVIKTNVISLIKR